MSKRFLFGVLLALTVPAAFAKTALDLMLEGRFSEAKAILDTSNVSPRYQLLYFAMVESDAARACSLYQVVAIRYPNSDCDSAARQRLDQAQDAGFMLVPIAEWAQASQEARPLALRRQQPRAVEAEVRPSEAVEPPPVAVSLPTLPVSVEVQAPPAAESEPQEKEAVVSVHDTILAAEKAPQLVEPVVVDTVPPPPPREVISAPAEAHYEPVVRETPVPPPPPPPAAREIISVPVEAEHEPAVTETPIPPTPSDERTPAPKVEKVAPAPVVETKEAEVAPPPSPAPSVVESSPTAPVSQDHPASGNPWYIQVGAFGNFDNAHRLALSLQNAGYPVKLVPRDTAKGKLLQVRVGGYATRTELAPIAEQLKEKFRVPTVFVTE